MYQSFVEYLKNVDGHRMMGDYEVNTDACYFLVVDTEIINEADNLVFTKYGVELPDWAWLVIIGGYIYFYSFDHLFSFQIRSYFYLLT